MTAVPNDAAGYKFDRWTGDFSGTTNPMTISVSDGPKSVVAVFAFKPEAVNLAGVRNLINNPPVPVILDVSASTDFNNSHILCARNYSWNTTTKQFEISITNLDPYKNSKILIYDQTGTRSKAAADYLAARGFAYLYYMTASLNDWIAAGYDTYVPAEDADICTSLAPMADADTDQTVTGGVRVTLDGSGSADPGGGALTYAWTQFKGSPTVTLTNADKARATFTSPIPTGDDIELVFHLTVTNSAGQKHTDSVTVTVVWFNDPPVADAGPNQTVEPVAVVTLDGSGSSDPDGTITAYAWTQTDTTGKNVTLSNPAAVKPTFTAPEVTETITLIFKLTITDNSGATDTHTVRITVTKPSSGGGGGGCFISTIP